MIMVINDILILIDMVNTAHESFKARRVYILTLNEELKFHAQLI